MRTTVYLDGKKITQKAAKEKMGDAAFKARLKEAKEAFMNDPYELIEYMDGMRFTFN